MRLGRKPRKRENLGARLEKEADRLGVSRYATFDGHVLDTAELQRRIWEYKAHRRNGLLWWIALVSCVASVVSAVAAWYAVSHMGR